MAELPKINKLIATENGPYIVTLEDDKKVALCRCGKSKNTPFCDGTHTFVGFKAKAFELTDVN